MYKGFKIIVLEGMDCCGKETVSKILARSLKKDNNIVLRTSIPDYMINDYLTNFITNKIDNKNLKKLTKESIYEVTRLFIHNMALSFHTKFNKKLRSINNTTKDKYIILDRYYHSGLIYQLKSLYDSINLSKNRIDNKTEAINMLISEFKKFLKEEKELFELPSPDYVFFIRSIPDIINTLISKRPSKGSSNNEDSKSIEDLYNFLFNQFTGKEDNVEYRYGYYKDFKDFCKNEDSKVFTIDNYTYFDYDRVDQLSKLIRVEYSNEILADYRLADPSEIVNYIRLLIDNKTDIESIKSLFLHDLKYIDAIVEEFQELKWFNDSLCDKQRDIQMGVPRQFYYYMQEPLECKKKIVDNYLKKYYNKSIS